MNREINQLFLDWKQRKNRKPLIVRGARQTGKTYAIEHFGKMEFAHYIKINLEESRELKGLFVNHKPKAILEELSLVFNTDIVLGKTLLFIDEIQSCPEAIVSLRYFYEQMPDLHVIAAGSLLDHTLNEMKLSMPVGRVEFAYMNPMTFKEFLSALSEKKLIGFIERFTLGDSVGGAVHKKLLELLRQYIFVGGMPEAVRVFAEKQKLLEIERVHSNILTSLQYDFAKYGSRSQQQHLLNTLCFVGQHPVRRIKYVNIDKEVRSIFIKEAIHKLALSRLIHPVRSSNSAGVPLTLHQNNDVFKALFLDIGLSNHLSKFQLTSSLDILTINEGALAEQFVGQEMLAMQPPYKEAALFYWTREQKNANAEVDYLFQQHNTIYPVEVKAGKSGTLKSMHVFLFEKKLKTGIRLNSDLPSVGKFDCKVTSGGIATNITYKLISLPLYFVSELPRLVGKR